MSYVITGALGNVGSAVIDGLQKMNASIKAVDINLPALKEKYVDCVDTAYFDFEKPETFANALDGATAVFVMRPPHLGDPESLRPFLQAVKAHGIDLVVFLSLMGVENNPAPPHHKIEKMIEQLELPYAHVRPGFFMQNLSGVHALEIAQDNEIFVPAGRS
ncbi:MAG: NAD(P)H-binding protein, partial [Culicoidibacterales bacterium]